MLWSTFQDRIHGGLDARAVFAGLRVSALEVDGRQRGAGHRGGHHSPGVAVRVLRVVAGGAGLAFSLGQGAPPHLGDDFSDDFAGFVGGALAALTGCAVTSAALGLR